MRTVIMIPCSLPTFMTIINKVVFITHRQSGHYWPQPEKLDKVIFNNKG